MSDCCARKSCELEALAQRQKRVLWLVLAINALMFVVEMAGGLISKSLSLTGDSLDMLGDAIAYGSSLAVVGMGAAQKSKAALLKATIMALSGLAVLGRALLQFQAPEVPNLALMVPTGGLALGANLICLYALTRHRHDDVNMSSVWLCSRNDIIANVAVLGAAGLVLVSSSPWPDLVVGLGITILFLKSALTVFKDARGDGLTVAPARSPG